MATWGGSRTGGGSGGDVVIRVTADDDASGVIKKLQDELNSLGNTGSGTSPKVGGIGKAFKDLGSQLKNFVNPTTAAVAAIGGIGLALTNAAKFSFEAAREMESLRVQLKTVEGSSQAADMRLADLVETGKEIAGLDLRGLVQFNSQLKNARLNSQETDVVMESVSKAMVEVGAGAADTARVLTQVTQAFAGNRLAAEDLKTLFADVGKATTAMQNVFGETATGISEFRDISEKLGLTAKQSLLLVFEELNRITEVDVNTTNAQWEIFNENMQALGATVGEPINEAVKETLKALNFLAEKTQEFFEWLDDERQFSNEEQRKLVQEASDEIVAIQDKAEKDIEVIQDRRKLFIQSAVNDIKAGEIAASAETLEAISADYVRRGENAKVFYESTREEIRITAQAELDVLKKKITNDQEVTAKALEEVQKRFENAGAYGETPEAKALMQQEMDKIVKASEERQSTWKQEASVLAQQARKDLGSVDEQETKAEGERAKAQVESNKIFLGQKVADATTAYGQLEDAGTANKDELISQSQAIYDAQVTLNGQTIKDKNKLYEANKTAAEENTSRLKEILGQEVSNAEAAYELIKDSDKTTKEEIEAHSQSVYDKQVELNNATITNQTELNLANEKAAQEYTDRINEFAEDRTKKEEEEVKKAAKAQKEYHDDLAEKNKTRADQTKIELDRITGDETTSLQERINANNTYYGFLMAEAANRETDEEKKAAAIELINQKRIDAQTTIEEDFAKEQDDRRKAEEKAQEEAKDAAVKREKELTETRIGELNHLEEVQLGVISDLDDADDASVEERIEATKKLYGIRLAKLNENKEDNKNYAADKEKLENELKDEVKKIIDEDKKNKADAEKEKRDEDDKTFNNSLKNAKNRVKIEEEAYKLVVNSSTSSADDINKQAQRAYEAKKAFIELNITDEEERAAALLAIEKELNERRTNLIEHFFTTNEQLIRQSVDIALDAANTIIGIKQEEVNATRQIEIDYAKSKTDFQTDRSTILAEYSGRMVAERAKWQPQIQAALDAGDQTEANRLVAERDWAIGMTSTGQVLNDEFGNMVGIVKEQSDALQGITDTLNDAHKEYHGGLRDIQEQIDEQKSKGFWDTVGSIADFGLEKIGQAVGTFFGSPEAGKIVGDLVGDVAKFGTDYMGDRAVSGIRDAAAETDLRFYRSDAWAETRAKNQNILQQLLGEIDWEEVAVDKKEADDQISESDDKTTEKIISNTDSIFERWDNLGNETLSVKEETDGKIVESDNIMTTAILDNLGTVTSIKNSTMEAEVENMKSSYEAQVQLNTDLTEQLNELLNTQVSDTASAGFNITDIMRAVNFTKESLAEDEVSTTKTALKTQVADTEKAGLNITHIIAALNAQKEAFTNQEAEKTKESLNAQVADTASAGLNITHIVAALNAQKKAFALQEAQDVKEGLDTQETDTQITSDKMLKIAEVTKEAKKAIIKSSLEDQIEQSKDHYTDLKKQDLEWRQYASQNEGFMGSLIKARLDNTLEDYRNFFAILKAEADDAYGYINRKIGMSNGSESRNRRSDFLPPGFGELFHNPMNDAIAYLGGMSTAARMSPNPTQKKNASDFTGFFSEGFLSKIQDSSGGTQNPGSGTGTTIFRLDFGDGVMKEVAAEIQQLENDKRSFKY